MSSRRTFRAICLALTIVMILSSMVFVLAACKKKNKNKGKTYDNENDILVFSSQEVDKVFNPFYSTSGADSNIVGMTQLGMIGNDEKGNPAYGDGEAVVTKDLEIVTVGEGEAQTTTYYFVLKNNVKFSNGSLLSIKDVLFNLYVYLDPVYTGSSTIYSTEIVGLKEYRTQVRDENEQDSFMAKYQDRASTRIKTLRDAAKEIFEDNKDYAFTISELTDELTAWAADNNNDTVVADFTKACALFREELEQDYSNSIDGYQDQLFTDEEGTVHKNLFTTDVEMFLYNEGYIGWNKKDAKLTSKLVNSQDIAELKNYTREQAINTVYNDQMPKYIDEILQYWNTSATLFEFLTMAEMEKDRPASGQLEFPNISGIKFANFNQAITVNGNSYAVPQYDAQGNILPEYNEVLSITIKKVDPKAIWNFAFGVAPLYYYSNRSFDYANNQFGVEYKSQTFMTDVVKNPSKIGVPVGAGPYAASKSSGGIDNISAGEFYDKGVIYFERNPYYLMGAPKIKKIRFQVVSSNAMLDSLYTNAIDFVEPNAKYETTQELRGKKDEGYDYKLVTTLGYGYIGVNAAKVPSVYIRRAIMYSIDTQMCVNYYKNLADPIYRSMSKESWAYPKNAVSYYPYIGGPVPADLNDLYRRGRVDDFYYEYVTDHGYQAGYKMTESEQIAFIHELMRLSRYTPNSDGIYSSGKNVCSYEFTIAGQETDHPAYGAMLKASELLNKCGFNVNVRPDKDALKKLSTGSLTVWAAAWGSTIDPDMYQVYHKDSTATSVLNWGYKQILANPGTYSFEYDLICGEGNLSDLIEQAREISYDDIEQEHKDRAAIYSRALDIVMKLAIELPTYQRNDLFAYNADKIDKNSLNQNPTSFKGLTTDMHLVSLITER